MGGGDAIMKDKTLKDIGAKMKDKNVKVHRVIINEALEGPYNAIAKMQLRKHT